MDSTCNVAEAKIPASSDLLELGTTHQTEDICNHLASRFDAGFIYTGLGDILVSVNPYGKIDQPKVKIDASNYHNPNVNPLSLEPHVYRTAELSLREIRNKGCKDVCIVVTGESGSGKTVSARILVEYYSLMSSKSGKGRLIEQQIPESNVIMEYFGNAQTERSINSSRFAKLTRVYFDSSARIIGAKQQSYMLEKSRVTSRHPCERNYHCFYAMLHGMPKSEKSKYHLMDVDFYDIVRVEKKSHLHDFIDDNERYRAFNVATSIFSQKTELMDSCLRILSALLWLGNVKFTSTRDAKVHIQNPDALKPVAEMLGVSFYMLEDLLKNKTLFIESKAEVTKTPYTVEQAYTFRDTLIRTIYDEFFALIIHKLNEELKPKVPHSYCITIVDAFGFESFDDNSLEQICINHANERLYINFVNAAIKNELRIFEEEGLGKLKLEVPESEGYTSLMQDKVNGIFAIINDQCRLTKSSDETIISKIKQIHSSNPLLKLVIESPLRFIIKHYAGEIIYNTDGFLEKSKLKVHAGILDLINSSAFSFIRELAREYEYAIVSQKSHSIGHRFCRQLDELVSELDNSRIFYIKCIRSNYDFSDHNLSRDAVCSQLLASGIPQALQVGRSILPVKIAYKDVYDSYYMLLKFSDRVDHHKDPVATANKILTIANVIDGCVMGRTMFLMDSNAGSVLEDLRFSILSDAALTIQRGWRVCKERAHMKRRWNAAMIIQSAALGMLARRHMAKLQSSSTKIQAVWRGVLARRLFKTLKEQREVAKRNKLKQAQIKAESKRLQESITDPAKTVDAPVGPHPVKHTASPQITTKTCLTVIPSPPLPSPPCTASESGKSSSYLKKMSEDLISTINSSIVTPKSSDSIYKSYSLSSRSCTLGLTGAKNTLIDLLSVDISSIDINSPDNQLENYTKDHIYRPKKGNTHSIRDLLFKQKDPAEELESYLHPKSSVASVPMLSAVANDKELSKLSVNVFKNLIRFSSLGPRCFDALLEIIEIGIENTCIRDEIYMQVIRQTNVYRNTGIIKRGVISVMGNYWLAFYAICNSFPPSKDLFIYVISYFLHRASFYKNISKTIYKYIYMSTLTVKKLYTFGARRLPPSIRELELLQIGSSSTELYVNLLGGSSIKCRIYSHTRVHEIISYVFNKFGFRTPLKWGLFLKTRDMDVPMDSGSYIYDEIHDIVNYIGAKKNEKIDYEISKILFTVKRTAFDTRDIPELLNSILSNSLMMQISQSLWYSSVFLDKKLSLTLSALALAYQSNETKIYLSDEQQFLLKVKSHLPSSVVQDLPAHIIRESYRIYQSNSQIEREVVMREYLNLALTRNEVYALLYHGVHIGTNQRCILVISSLGVNIISAMDRSIINCIRSNLLMYCEREDRHLYMYSITDDLQKGVTTFGPLTLDCVETVSAHMALAELDKITNQHYESADMLRKIFAFSEKELTHDLLKAREALITNNIIRPLTVDEEIQYNNFVALQAIKRRARTGLYSGWRGTLFTRKNKNAECTRKDSYADSKEKNDAEMPVNLSPDSCVWINYPIDLKKPLTNGRVPATWSIELWNFLQKLGSQQEWLSAVKEFFLRVCFGAPQAYADELFLMLAKVTTGDYMDSTMEDDPYAYRLWTVFSIVIHYISPSPLIYSYIHAHIRSSLNNYLDKKASPQLNKILLVINQCRKNLLSNPLKPRKRSPTLTELEHATALFHVVIGMRLFSLNNIVVVQIKPTTTFEKLCQYALDRIGLRTACLAEYAVYRISADGWIMCEDKDYVCDSLSSEGEKCGKDALTTDTFVVRRILQRCNADRIESIDEKYNYIIQIVSDICSGLLPVPAILNFAKIAASFVQYESGDFNMSTPISLYERAQKYMPQCLKDNNKVTPSNIREWHMALTGMSKAAAISAIATMLSKWKLHNAVIFDVDQEHDLSFERHCQLALTPDEMLICTSPDGEKHKARISLADITGVFDYENSVIVIHNTNGVSTKAIFSTPRHSELAYFIKVHSGHA